MQWRETVRESFGNHGQPGSRENEDGSRGADVSLLVTVLSFILGWRADFARAQGHDGKPKSVVSSRFMPRLEVFPREAPCNVKRFRPVCGDVSL